MKDILSQKDFEIIDLKKTVKATKINELELETKAYMQECVRLRKISERAVQMSGEIDLEKIKRQYAEFQDHFKQRQEDQQR